MTVPADMTVDNKYLFQYFHPISGCGTHASLPGSMKAIPARRQILLSPV